MEDLSTYTDCASIRGLTLGTYKDTNKLLIRPIVAVPAVNPWASKLLLYKVNKVTLTPSNIEVTFDRSGINTVDLAGTGIPYSFDTCTNCVGSESAFIDVQDMPADGPVSAIRLAGRSRGEVTIESLCADGTWVSHTTGNLYTRDKAMTYLGYAVYSAVCKQLHVIPAAVSWDIPKETRSKLHAAFGGRDPDNIKYRMRDIFCCRWSDTSFIAARLIQEGLLPDDLSWSTDVIRRPFRAYAGFYVRTTPYAYCSLGALVNKEVPVERYVKTVTRDFMSAYAEQFLQSDKKTLCDKKDSYVRLVKVHTHCIDAETLRRRIAKQENKL